jgi:hypothetical protein
VLAAGTSAPDYAAHLLALAQAYRSSLPTPMVALPMARPSQLEGRLLAVLAGAARRRPPTRRVVVAIAAAMLLMTLPLSALELRPMRGVSADATALPLPDTDATQQTQPIAAAAADSIIERTVVARSGGSLLLDLRTGGSVHVTSWDEESVYVRARLSGRDWRSTAVSVEPSADGVRVVAWDVGSRAEQSTSHAFEIRVPRTFDIQLRSATGDVALRGLSGTFGGTTGAGDVHLTALSGRLDLTTGRGNVRVEESDLSGSVRTGAGEVSLLRVRGGLAASSGSGRVRAGSGEPPRADSEPARAESERARAGSEPARGVAITTGDDSIARIVRRIPVSEAAHAITTRDGRTALLLRDTTIVLQLTDHGLNQLGRDAETDENNLLAAVLSSMLRGGLRVLLDRGIEYSLRDLREARYQNGRLVLESRRGDDVFADVNVNGGPVMEQFSDRDARAFVRRVNAARSRLRR